MLYRHRLITLSSPFSVQSLTHKTVSLTYLSAPRRYSNSDVRSQQVTVYKANMTDKLSSLPLPDIEWTEATSKNGVPFRYGVEKKKTETKVEASVSDGPINVNWPVAPTNAWVPVDVFGIWQYSLVGTTPGGLFNYLLTFTNQNGWDYSFKDESGDTYSVATIRNGDHILQYNSAQPTIVQVFKND